MNQKILAVGLIVLSFALYTPKLTAATSPFPDISAASEHAAAIDFLKNKGIITGYPDGTFQPDKTINRAEALKLLFLSRKVLNISDAATSTTVNFPDVKASDWFYEYVQKAASQEIVKGYEDGTFKPANEITAAESLKIMEIGLITGFQAPTVSTAPFTDVIISSWYAPFLEFAKVKQIIEARGDGSYAPDRKMTRAEFAEAIYRVIYLQSNKVDRFPLSLNWQYCNNFELGYKIKHPFSWEMMVANDQMVFWKKDEANGQVSFARVYPNSAVAVVAVDSNNSKLSLDKYMDLIEYGEGSSKQVITLNGLPYASVQIEQSGLQDSYFQMPNGQIVIIYAQIGDGALSSQLKEEMRYIIGSVRESKTATDEQNCLAGVVSSSTNSGTGTTTTVSPEETLTAEILKLVLIDGKANEALGKINDELLFSTDSLGIGTGPVDYYYSASLNLSIKVDRDSATILATKSGKTSEF